MAASSSSAAAGPSQQIAFMSRATEDGRPYNEQELKICEYLEQMITLVSTVISTKPGQVPVFTEIVADDLADIPIYTVESIDLRFGKKILNDEQFDASIDFVAQRVAKLIDMVQGSLRVDPNIADVVGSERFVLIAKQALNSIETARHPLGGCSFARLRAYLSFEKGDNRFEKFKNTIVAINMLIAERTPPKITYHMSAGSSDSSGYLNVKDVLNRFIQIVQNLEEYSQEEIKKILAQMSNVLEVYSTSEFEKILGEADIIGSLLRRIAEKVMRGENVELNLTFIILFLKNFKLPQMIEHRETCLLIEKALREVLMDLTGRRVSVDSYSSEVKHQIRELIHTEMTFNTHMEDFSRGKTAYTIIKSLETQGFITGKEGKLLLKGRDALKRNSSFFLNMLRGEVDFTFEMIDSYLNNLGGMALKNELMSGIFAKIQAAGSEAEQIIRKNGMIPQVFETRINEPFQRIIRLKMLLQEIERAGSGHVGLVALMRYLKIKLDLVNAMKPQTVDHHEVSTRVELLRDPSRTDLLSGE